MAATAAPITVCALAELVLDYPEQKERGRLPSNAGRISVNDRRA